MNDLKPFVFSIAKDLRDAFWTQEMGALVLNPEMC